MSIFNTGTPVNKFTKIVPVFLTINGAYAPYAGTAIKSLTEHTNPDRFYRVIILHDGLDLIDRIRLRALATKNVAIQFKKIDNSIYLKVLIRHCTKEKGAGDFFSSAVYYYRAFIASMFPNYEKAVYIDSDVILRADIAELFDLDLGDKVIAATVDPKVAAIPEFRDYVKNIGIPADEYINSGVMLMSLKKLRKTKYLKKMITIITEDDPDLVAPDQDFLNAILRGQILHLDQKWNVGPDMYDRLPKSAKIVHFNLMNKPWHYKNVPQEKLFWDAAKGTGFYNILKSQQANFTEEDAKNDAARTAALIEKAGILAKKKNMKIKVPKDEIKTSKLKSLLEKL